MTFYNLTINMMSKSKALEETPTAGHHISGVISFMLFR